MPALTWIRCLCVQIPSVDVFAAVFFKTRRSHSPNFYTLFQRESLHCPDWQTMETGANCGDYVLSFIALNSVRCFNTNSSSVFSITLTVFARSDCCGFEAIVAHTQIAYLTFELLTTALSIMVCQECLVCSTALDDVRGNNWNHSAIGRSRFRALPIAHRTSGAFSVIRLQRLPCADVCVNARTCVQNWLQCICACQCIRLCWCRVRKSLPILMHTHTSNERDFVC